MLNAAEITKIVDRMGEIKRQLAELNSESDTLEAMLLKQFEADVEDTKYKSIKYRGTESEVSAAYADSVKLIYPSMLKKIFGEAYRLLPKKPHISCQPILKGCCLPSIKRILLEEQL